MGPYRLNWFCNVQNLSWNLARLMITFTSNCPVCSSKKPICGYAHWTVRVTEIPLDTLPDIRAVGEILGISPDICLGNAFCGKLTKKDVVEIFKKCTELGFSTFYAYRQHGRKFPFGVYVSEGYFKGSFRVDLRRFSSKEEESSAKNV